jgi:hypothetical protein
MHKPPRSRDPRDVGLPTDQSIVHVSKAMVQHKLARRHTFRTVEHVPELVDRKPCRSRKHRTIEDPARILIDTILQHTNDRVVAARPSVHGESPRTAHGGHVHYIDRSRSHAQTYARSHAPNTR